MFWATIFAQISSNVSAHRPDACRKSLRHTLAPFSDAKFRPRPTARLQHVGLRVAAILCHLAPAAAGHWQSPATSSSTPTPPPPRPPLRHLPTDPLTNISAIYRHHRQLLAVSHLLLPTTRLIRSPLNVRRHQHFPLNKIHVHSD